MSSAIRLAQCAARRGPAAAARCYATKPDVSFPELQRIIHGVSPAPYALIDVREPHEVAEGRVPTAVNIPLGDVAAAFALPPDKFAAKYGVGRPSASIETIFYCRSGKRSQSAIDQVEKVDASLSLRNYRGSWLDYLEHALANKHLK
ncbi:hypothetical protein IWQ57_001861 [Coemansia nantahalensis]|uniref:Uncharacterized protein n=1 Tax=Coemansia nantahalensis TaxID=2789366 RepID=A0ACC1K2E6_9FUNG|nr:hypothetical protein IWQ57_001861 [Coemansia nantahalensis]